MQYHRRADIDNTTRIEIAIEAFTKTKVYGAKTQIAKKHKVSRLFVYQLLWQLKTLFEVEIKEANLKKEQQRTLDKHLLLYRLELNSALEAISETLKHLELGKNSKGYLSKRLMEFAELVPKDLPIGITIRIYLSDEIFANSIPILITVDPKSLAILRIELAEKRDAETWKAHWEAIGKTEKVEVVSDLGTGLVKGCALVGIVHHPDLFHLIQPLALLGARFEKQAYSAIEYEFKREGVCLNSKTEKTFNQKLEQYEQAKADSTKRIELFDNFIYLWREFKHNLDLFNDDGTLKDANETLSEALTILELLAELRKDVADEVETLRRALESYWSYAHQAKKLHSELGYTAELLNLLCSAWQLLKKAKNSKNYGHQKILKSSAASLIEKAANRFPVEFSEAQKNIFETLDSNVRASSLVENVNSGLRRLFNTCRGQVTQGLLDLFAFKHNHRRFLRGERKGQAPIEILTGKTLEMSWVDSLLELMHPNPSPTELAQYPISIPSSEIDLDYCALAA